MAKLDVVAAQMETEDFKLKQMQLVVSVARSDDGSPVTGLQSENFRISCQPALTPTAVAVAELSFNPAFTKPAGVYHVWLTRENGFSEGHTYEFGIQVRILGVAPLPNPPPVKDQGQTVITMIAKGDE